MRRVFALIESLQSRLLEEVGIGPFDERLGRWRRTALRAFEREWAERAGKGRALTEEDAATVYLDCLVEILTKDGIDVPDELSGSAPS